VNWTQTLTVNYSYHHGKWITVHITSEINCNMPSVANVENISVIYRGYNSYSRNLTSCHLDKCICSYSVLIIRWEENTILTWGRVIVQDLSFKPLQLSHLFNSKVHFQLPSQAMYWTRGHLYFHWLEYWNSMSSSKSTWRLFLLQGIYICTWFSMESIQDTKTF